MVSSAARDGWLLPPVPSHLSASSISWSPLGTKHGCKHRDILATFAPSLSQVPITWCCLLLDIIRLSLTFVPKVQAHSHAGSCSVSLVSLWHPYRFVCTVFLPYTQRTNFTLFKFKHLLEKSNIESELPFCSFIIHKTESTLAD